MAGPFAIASFASKSETAELQMPAAVSRALRCSFADEYRMANRPSPRQQPKMSSGGIKRPGFWTSFFNCFFTIWQAGTALCSEGAASRYSSCSYVYACRYPATASMLTIVWLLWKAWFSLPCQTVIAETLDLQRVPHGQQYTHTPHHTPFLAFCDDRRHAQLHLWRRCKLWL